MVAFCLVTRFSSLSVSWGFGVFWSRVMAKAVSNVLFWNGAWSMSALIIAVFVWSFIRFCACLRIPFEMSMPTVSLALSAMWGNSRPVPQPASRVMFCFLRVSSVSAAFSFVSCSSWYCVSYTVAAWL